MDAKDVTGMIIGIPSRGKKVAVEWGVLLANQNYPLNLARGMVVLRDKPNEPCKDIGAKRNEIVEFALDKKAKYIWFIDDDVAVPSHASRHLIYLLESSDDDVMAAGGIYCSKIEPPEPTVYRGDGLGAFWKWKKGEVFEVSGIGTGCMMIKTEVFSKISKPWFKTDSANNVSDDLWFCKKVIAAGYKILADGNVLCDHYNYDFDPPRAYRLPEDSYPMKEEKPMAVAV